MSKRGFVLWSDVPAERNPGLGPWVIYALVDPSDNGVRYVGVTTGDLAVRLAGHLARPTNGRMASWLQGLSGNGVRPQIRPIFSPRDQWENAERGWIAWFRQRGDLLNSDPGGICRKAGGQPIARKMRQPRDWKNRTPAQAERAAVKERKHAVVLKQRAARAKRLSLGVSMPNPEETARMCRAFLENRKDAR